MPRADYPFHFREQVRWGDLDALGHVNHTRFFTYCESTRMAWFKAIQLEQHMPGGVGPSLIKAECTFLRQLRFPAELEVGQRVGRIGNSSFTLDYGVFLAGEDAPVGEASVVVVWTDYEAGSSLPLPAELRPVLEAAQGS